MDETPAPTPAPAAPTTAPAVPPVDSARQAAARRRWAWIAVALAAVALLAAASIEQRRQWQALADELAAQRQALATAQSAAAAARQEATQARQQAAQLEQALGEVKAERADAEQLYQELARGRDEAVLIDVERMVNLALQELQIGGNVAAALTALQNADARLARLQRPQLTTLRRALARDIDRLKAIAPLDLTGNALRIDQLVRQVDELPLLADPAARLAPAPAGRPPAPTAVAPAATPSAADGVWGRVRAWLAAEFGQLVQIREVAAPESVLLSGAQQQAVRDRLRLRLLDARQSLLARNERLYRADVAEAQALLARFFDTRAPAVQQMNAQLKQLGGIALALEPPSLADSLEALRSARPGAAR